MRCKIGDECFLICCPPPCVDANGRIVRIVGIGHVDDWEIIFIHGLPPSLQALRVDVVCANDKYLIPIRGDLCKDEVTDEELVTS